ncbi:MAG: phospholipid carrier-dependent glycosyltransferase, partial [Candidatus Omnitrophica bacterium]|nr:phospholipid carrier-dependent glycosyltransferase [Candidatus Omnitrophota bacterium]
MRPRIVVASAIGAILASYGAVNLFLLSRYYQAVIHADESFHLVASLDLYRIFTFSFPEKLPLSQVATIFVGFAYPPFFYICAALANLPGGFSKAHTVTSNLLFVYMLLGSTYLIGKKLTGDWRTGLYAAFICAMFPMVFAMSGFVMLDLPLTATVTLVFCCLLYTRDFGSLRMSLLFGVSLGVALFTKWTAPFFIVGPLTFAVWHALRPAEERLKKIRNILFALVTAMIFASWWYTYQIISAYFIRKDKLEAFLVVGKAITEKTLPFYSFDGILYYAQSIFPYQVSLFFSLLFLLGAFLFLRSGLRGKVMFALWVLAPYAVFTLIASKSPRYIMPVLPAIALMTALGISRITSVRVRRSIVACSVCFGILQYCLLSFMPSAYISGTGLLKAAIQDIFYTGILNYENYFSFDWLRYYKTAYRQRGQVNTDLLTILSGYRKRLALQRPLRVGVIWPSTIWGERSARSPYPVSYLADNIGMTGFYENTQKFLREAGNFDILILRAAEKDWPSRQEIAEDFRKCNIEVFNKLTPQDMQVFEKLFEDLRRQFLPVRLIKIGQGTYLYILLNQKFFDDTLRVVPYQAHSGVLEAGETRLIFKDGRLSVFYAGKQITQNDGFFFSFVFDNKRRDNLEAFWDVKSVSGHELIARASWPGIPVQQEWKLGITENSLRWQVRFISDERLVLNDINAKISLGKDYGEWFDCYEKGTLGRPNFNAEEISVDLRMYSGVLGLSGVSTRQTWTPWLALDARANPLGLSYSLHRVSGQAQKVAENTEFVCHNHRNKLELPKGGHDALFMKVFFFAEDKGLVDFVSRIRPEGEVGEGNLRFFFDKGAGRIFWKGEELTKGFNFYLQLRSPAISFLSTDMEWEQQKLSQARLLARGRHASLPRS